MAKRKRSGTSKRRFKRRRFSRRRKRRNRVPRNLIPNRTTRRLVYSDQISINPGVGTPDGYIFSANSIFDPDTTGIGHQPLGTDQYLGVLYDHFTVIGSMITLDFMTGGTGIVNDTIVAVCVRDTNTLVTDMNQLIEQGRSRHKILTNANAGATRRIKYKVNPAKFLGVSHPMSEKDLQGNVTSNPAEQCFFIIAAQSASGQDPFAIAVQVKIEYIVVFSEPKFLNLS